MPNISSIIKNVRNIMRNEDQGISGDAQRLEQLGWMLFLKILDDKDQELELLRKGYQSVVPEKFQWRTSASPTSSCTAWTCPTTTTRTASRPNTTPSARSSRWKSSSPIPFAIPKTWEWCRLADIARHSLGKMLDKGKNRGTEKPYLRNLNVRWYEVELSDLKTMPFEERELEKYSVRRGDVLICEGGHGIGRAAVWNSDDTVMFQKALHRVRFFGGFFEPEVFVHFLRWSETSGHITKFYTGAGIPHLTGDSIHEMPVPLPPLAEQAAIVARVETLLGSSRKLAMELAASRTHAAHLLQAVLKAAFTPAA